MANPSGELLVKKWQSQNSLTYVLVLLFSWCIMYYCNTVEVTHGRGGGGKSHIIWRRESMVLYKSFNTVHSERNLHPGKIYPHQLNINCSSSCHFFESTSFVGTTIYVQWQKKNVFAVERRRRGTEPCWHRQIQPLFLHFIYRETLIKMTQKNLPTSTLEHYCRRIIFIDNVVY